MRDARWNRNELWIFTEALIFLHFFIAGKNYATGLTEERSDLQNKFLCSTLRIQSINNQMLIMDRTLISAGHLKLKAELHHHEMTILKFIATVTRGKSHRCYSGTLVMCMIWSEERGQLKKSEKQQIPSYLRNDVHVDSSAYCLHKERFALRFTHIYY